MPTLLALFVETMSIMSLIGKNIKKIRAVKKLSQTAFADLLSLSRTSVGAYEEERAEPKIDTVILIANHFGISIDSLLSKELTINEVLKFDKHSERFLKKDSLQALPSWAHPIFDLGRLSEYRTYLSTGALPTGPTIGLASHIKVGSLVFRLDREVSDWNLQKGDLVICSPSHAAVFGYLLLHEKGYQFLKDGHPTESALPITETISFGRSRAAHGTRVESVEFRVSVLEEQVKELTARGKAPKKTPLSS